MGAHRKKTIKRNCIQKYVFLKKRETVHNKKFIHVKNYLNEMIHITGGYPIGFLQLSTT